MSRLCVLVALKGSLPLRVKWPAFHVKKIRRWRCISKVPGTASCIAARLSFPATRSLGLRSLQRSCCCCHRYPCCHLLLGDLCDHHRLGHLYQRVTWTNKTDKENESGDLNRRKSMGISASVSGCHLQLCQVSQAILELRKKMNTDCPKIRGPHEETNKLWIYFPWICILYIYRERDKYPYVWQIYTIYDIYIYICDILKINILKQTQVFVSFHLTTENRYGLAEHSVFIGNATVVN